MTAHTRSLHVRPLGIVGGAAAAAALESGAGQRLAGGRLVYTACGIFLTSEGEDGTEQLETTSVLPLAETIAWADREGNETATAMHDWLKRMSVSPPSFAGFFFLCRFLSLSYSCYPRPLRLSVLSLSSMFAVCRTIPPFVF